MLNINKFKLSQKSLLLLSISLASQMAIADIIHNDDVIVDNLCASDVSTCANGENFNGPGSIGLASIKIKDSIPILWFDDTSAGSTNDWALDTNVNFEIRSQSGNSVPFVIEENVATTAMLTIDSNERVGIGTINPGETLEVASAQPAIRLNDTNAGRVDLEMSGNEFIIQENTNRNRLVLETNGNAASANQFYMDSDGDVSVGGIVNPTHALHVKSDGSDYIVFDSTTQDWSWYSSNSYTALVNHSTNDHTFRIYPSNSGDNGLVLRNNKVGINNLTPTASVHVKDSITDMLLLENTHATTGIRKLMRMSNKGAVGFEMVDRSIPSPGLDGRTWQFRSDGVGNFIINQPQFPGAELQLQNDGDLFIKGTLTEGSSRAIKTDITSLKSKDFMEKLSKVEVLEWRYKSADKEDRHIGPIAEDFYKLFKLGTDDKRISPRDVASVALLAAKELQKNTHSMATALKSNESKTKALEAENSILKNRLLALEKLVTNLASGEGVLPETGRKVTLLK